MYRKTFEELVRCVDAKNTSERHRKTHKTMAEKDFADHVITEEQPGVFRCAKPGTGFYAFRIAFLPGGMIVVYGDVGDMMIQRGGNDGEAWGRAYYEHTGDCEYPDCRDYNSNDMRCYHALSWFVRARQREEAAA